MLSWLKINKLLLLHLVGYLHCLYQWYTVKQISNFSVRVSVAVFLHVAVRSPVSILKRFSVANAPYTHSLQTHCLQYFRWCWNCFDWIFKTIKCNGPPLWSSGQSFWLQVQRSRFRFPALPDFLSSTGSGTGSTQPREVNWGATWIKSSGSGPDSRD